ncbi:MAG TPA: hypothetical protein VHO68_01960, partial [Bacteroidales bacterium]|nr:hypothetical protein [Bacteroidales bacterium]
YVNFSLTAEFAELLHTGSSSQSSQRLISLNSVKDRFAPEKSEYGKYLLAGPNESWTRSLKIMFYNNIGIIHKQL